MSILLTILFPKHIRYHVDDIMEQRVYVELR